MSRRRRPHALVPIALATAGATLLTACGTSTLDTGEVEKTIASQFKAKGIPLTDVRCRDEIEAKVGTPVSCTGKNPGGTVLRLEGKVSERNGDRARFEVKAVGGTAIGSVIAAQTKAVLEQQVGQKADGMTCPKTVEIPTKRPIRCVLTAGGTRLGVSVTVDENGRLDAKVDDQPRS
ncbi:hypothetical protein PAI11_18280 [Patulibacter medicamentivorans]|uniref:DUF4333 domain-containing protein n=1 Tax=Patulibacter medicamentivorans TaxID=1097667 RepID=H0E4U7_9ACTN|nr:DUF4333 domain-containing protein [Patulibacter medicamentivorans]EHN11300.1 hypothetical protein PAI11_18280 [Patulibacter medicamentivorans]